ncbi:hypothetical protein ES708_09889 [subsurface metagenome]
MKWTPIAAIIAIVILETIALLKGVNGALMGIAVAALAGLGGYEAKTLRDKIKGGKQ